MSVSVCIYHSMTQIYLPNLRQVSNANRNQPTSIFQRQTNMHEIALKYRLFGITLVMNWSENLKIGLYMSVCICHILCILLMIPKTILLIG